MAIVLEEEIVSLKTLALGLVMALIAWSPANAQRGPSGTWELLAEEKVGFGGEHDIIRLRHNEDFYRNKAYRRLRFVAERGEVRMKSIRLVYLNGYAEDMVFNQNLRPGQNIDIDLRGERSYLAQIEMFYKSKFGLSISPGGIRVGQATMKIYGENVRFGPPGPPPGPPGPPPHVVSVPGWHTLAAQGFDRRDSVVDIAVGRREGRLGQIALHLKGERISVREVRIRFHNGETQNVRFTHELTEGVLSPPIDLIGDRRFIANVTVLLDPRRRPGPASITLLGTERPGGGGPRR